MGDLPEQKERILIALPVPEPKSLVDGLRQKFKHAEISYKQISWPHAKPGTKEAGEDISDGTNYFRNS